MIQFDEHIFQIGWFNHQLESDAMCKALVVEIYNTANGKFIVVTLESGRYIDDSNLFNSFFRGDLLYYNRIL